MENLTNGEYQNLTDKRNSSVGYLSSKTLRNGDRDGSLDSKNRGGKNKLKSSLKLLILILIPAILLIFSFRYLTRTTSSADNNKIQMTNPKATQQINKEFFIPVRDNQKQEISKVKFNIETADIRDEIVIKGQKATAVEGRIFLIINFKVTNEYNQAIRLNTRDYIRLSVNGNENEWLASDIHNDPVEIQPQSTKYTRLGFPISVTDKNLKLRVGEIDGEKESIELTLQ